MTIQPNLAKDGLTIQEAADLAGIPVSRIRFAVMQGLLQCGIFIKPSWKGFCIPDSRKPIACETTHVAPQGYTNKDFKSRYHKWKTDDGTMEVTVAERFINCFWYLDLTDALWLFVSPAGIIDVSLLRPYNGAAWHEHDPLGYPKPPFQFWVASDNNNRHITTADLLFLKEDVVAFRQQYLTPPQEIQPDNPLSVSDGYDQRFGHSNQQVSDRGMWNQPRLKKKIDGLQRQWESLSEKLSGLNEQWILETRVEEKLRLRKPIDETKTQRDQVEEQLKDMESQLAKVDGDAKKVAGRNDDHGRFSPDCALRSRS